MMNVKDYKFQTYAVGEEISFQDAYTRMWRTGTVKQVATMDIALGYGEKVQQERWLVDVPNKGEFIVRQFPKTGMLEGEKRL